MQDNSSDNQEIIITWSTNTPNSPITDQERLIPVRAVMMRQTPIAMNKSMELARTEPMTLNVQRTPALSIAAATSAGSALRFVKDEPSGEPLNLHYNTQFWVLLAVPLTLLLGVQIASRYRQQAIRRVVRKPDKL